MSRTCLSSSRNSARPSAFASMLPGFWGVGGVYRSRQSVSRTRTMITRPVGSMTARGEPHRHHTQHIPRSPAMRSSSSGAPCAFPKGLKMGPAPCRFVLGWRVWDGWFVYESADGVVIEASVPFFWGRRVRVLIRHNPALHRHAPAPAKPSAKSPYTCTCSPCRP